MPFHRRFCREYCLTYLEKAYHGDGPHHGRHGTDRLGAEPAAGPGRLPGHHPHPASPGRPGRPPGLPLRPLGSCTGDGRRRSAGRCRSPHPPGRRQRCRAALDRSGQAGNRRQPRRQHPAAFRGPGRAAAPPRALSSAPQRQGITASRRTSPSRSARTRPPPPVFWAAPAGPGKPPPCAWRRWGGGWCCCAPASS